MFTKNLLSVWVKINFFLVVRFFHVEIVNKLAMFWDLRVQFMIEKRQWAQSEIIQQNKSRRNSIKSLLDSKREIETNLLQFYYIYGMELHISKLKKKYFPWIYKITSQFWYMLVSLLNFDAWSCLKTTQRTIPLNIKALLHILWMPAVTNLSLYSQKKGHFLPSKKVS